MLSLKKKKKKGVRLNRKHLPVSLASVRYKVQDQVPSQRVYQSREQPSLHSPGIAYHSWHTGRFHLLLHPQTGHLHQWFCLQKHWGGKKSESYINCIMWRTSNTLWVFSLQLGTTTLFQKPANKPSTHFNSLSAPANPWYHTGSWLTQR